MMSDINMIYNLRKIRGTMSITHPPQAVPGPRINITYNAFTLDTDDTEASWNQAKTLSKRYG